MHPKPTLHSSLITHYSSLATLAAGLMLLVGCNQPPAVNPWRDDSITAATWTTASEQGILAKGHAPALRQRPVAASVAPNVSNEVPHYPLWWEDPFEDKGDMDGKFAWTWQDYFAMPYSYARWHLNTIGWPVSAIVDPGWKSMVSDGYVGPCRPHDARPGHSPDPTADASDFGVEDPTLPHSANIAVAPTTAPAEEAQH